MIPPWFYEVKVINLLTFYLNAKICNEIHFVGENKHFLLFEVGEHKC